MTKFKKNKLSVAVDNVYNEDYDTEDQVVVTDEEGMDLGTWDDLMVLKNSVAESVLEFTSAVGFVSANKESISQVDTEVLPKFIKSVESLFRDLDIFSVKIANLLKRHEHLSGPIASLDDVSLYTEISLEYQTLLESLMMVTQPTLASVMEMVTSTAIKASEDLIPTEEVSQDE